MQALLIIAAVLAIATGVIHSVLGERLIFRHLRTTSLIPSLPAPPLQSRHVRILWATWHLASVLAFGFAAILLQLAGNPGAALSTPLVLGAMASVFLAGALLVLAATRGHHPGWIALAAVGILSWLAIGAT